MACGILYEIHISLPINKILVLCSCAHWSIVHSCSFGNSVVEEVRQKLCTIWLSVEGGGEGVCLPCGPLWREFADCVLAGIPRLVRKPGDFGHSLSSPLIYALCCLLSHRFLLVPLPFLPWHSLSSLTAACHCMAREQGRRWGMCQEHPERSPSVWSS